jgi:hypothetical protein
MTKKGIKQKKSLNYEILYHMHSFYVNDIAVM